ncbi:MAG: copper amine oxidase-like protein [Symbiobacteriaceae bacterium]|jgi:hypothetical protein|nr:copper amine oxidase-like protein [Symbiobacteriaceae bacterium]
MRKFWVGLALVGLVVVSSVAGGWAATGARKQLEVEYRDIKIAVNGKTVNVGESEPFVVTGEWRTYVPARPLAEALGASVGWNESTSTVEVFASDYVKSTINGEYRVWSVPAQGMSLKAPRGFINLDLGFGLFQLGLIDLFEGVKGVVVVNRTDVPNDGSTARARVDQTLTGLSYFFLPDMKLIGESSEENVVTVGGTTKFMGQPATFAVRNITQDGSDWMVLTLIAGGYEEQLMPVMGDILDSVKFETP